MPSVLIGVTVPFTAIAFLVDQAQLLRSRGWEVHLFTSNGPGIAHLMELDCWQVHIVEISRGGLVPLDGKGLLQIVRLLRRIRPDVVVVSTPKGGFVGSIAGYLCRVPVRIYHARGLRAEGLTGLSRFLSLAAERVSTGLATYVLVDSRSLLAAMRESRCLARNKGHVLGSGSASGVDILHFRPATVQEREQARVDLTISGETVAVGFIGRLTTDKGVRELIEATKSIRNRGALFSLLLVGPIEDMEIHKVIQEEASWLHWYDYQADVKPFLWAMDIFCLPSYREGLPIATLEASAVGLPVVTTDVTGCRDSIINEKTGILVSARDEQSLAEALMRLATNTRWRRQLGQEGRAWITRDFSSVDVNHRFTTLIEELHNQGT